MKSLPLFLTLLFYCSFLNLLQAQIEIYSCVYGSNLKKTSIDANDNCTTESVGGGISGTQTLKDIAFHPDGFLYSTDGDNLYRINLNTNTQTSINTLDLPPGDYINSLVSDAQGNLYGASRNNNVDSSAYLYLINTGGEVSLLGELPYLPAGDLFFFKGDLFLTGISYEPLYAVHIVKVDIQEPANSIIEGTTSESSYGNHGRGAAVYVDSCNNSRVFINSRSWILELYMETISLSETICFPNNLDGMSIPGDYMASECFNCNNLGVSSVVFNPPFCNGGMNGSIKVIPEGGAEPYTYLWDDPNEQVTDLASNLTAGTYSVTIIDANLCSFVSDPFILSDPPL
jgi:hypothetical protein